MSFTVGADSVRQAHRALMEDPGEQSPRAVPYLHDMSSTHFNYQNTLEASQRCCVSAA